MARLPAWARSYSCPHERFDAETTDQIVTEYAKEYCARFVDRFGNVVEGQSPNLIPFLRQGLSKFDEFEGAWDVAVGYTRRTLLFNNQNDAPRQAAWLGLRMTECGAGGEWEATLPHPTRLRWDRWLLPPARWLSVRSDGRHFRQAGIKRMNFLLPDVSHDTKQRWYGQAGQTPVADDLIPIFDEWVREPGCVLHR